MSDTETLLTAAILAALMLGLRVFGPRSKG